MKRFKLFVYVIAAALLVPLFCSVVAADLVTVYVADQNVALGKTYVASEPFTATPPQMGYQDIDGHELTDGASIPKPTAKGRSSSISVRSQKGSSSSAPK